MNELIDTELYDVLNIELNELMIETHKVKISRLMMEITTELFRWNVYHNGNELLFHLGRLIKWLSYFVYKEK
jgi:hypothetical protein